MDKEPNHPLEETDVGCVFLCMLIPSTAEEDPLQPIATTVIFIITKVQGGA